MSIYDDLRSRFSVEPAAKWSADNERALLEPYTYVTSNPGKDMRKKLIDAFNLWLHVPKQKLEAISTLITMLHNASLLLDDIEDDAQLRRGDPVAHKIYGVPQTINTANYVYFLAFKHLATLQQDIQLGNKTDVHTIVLTEMLNLHRGQGLEILWRDSLRCPTEEEYMWMVNNKTGGLLRLGIKLLMASATTNVDVDYVPLVNLMGVYFQIRDDLMNLQTKGEYATNKGFAEDLTEGKFSFPVVHSIHADTSNRQVMNVLAKRPSSPTLKQHAISYMKSRTKSFDYTLQVLNNLEKQTRDEIARLGGNTQLEAWMDALRVTPEMIGLSEPSLHQQ